MIDIYVRFDEISIVSWCSPQNNHLKNVHYKELVDIDFYNDKYVTRLHKMVMLQEVTTTKFLSKNKNGKKKNEEKKSRP